MLGHQAQGVFLCPPPPQNCMNLPPDKVQLLSQYDNEKKWELICDQVGAGTGSAAIASAIWAPCPEQASAGRRGSPWAEILSRGWGSIWGGAGGSCGTLHTFLPWTEVSPRNLVSCEQSWVCPEELAGAESLLTFLL
jgi:hypothetical protein